MRRNCTIRSTRTASRSKASRGRAPAVAVHRAGAGVAEEGGAAQASLDLETYTENALINEIRGYLDSVASASPIPPTGA